MCVCVCIYRAQGILMAGGLSAPPDQPATCGRGPRRPPQVYLPYILIHANIFMHFYCEWPSTF